MLGLLKNKPWRNLTATLTSPIPLPLLILFIIYSISIPALVIIGHNGISIPNIKHILNIFCLLLILFIPRYLRTGKNLLSLNSTHKNGVFQVFYHTILKIGGIFAVVFFTYVVVVISLLALASITGIREAQEIPDLTHLTFPMVIYKSFSAGLSEEVWRIVTIILVLGMFKRILGAHWSKNIVKILTLFFTVVFTSFAFGWMHTFGYSSSYFSVPIIVQIGIMGIILSGVILVTRRIWYAVFFHFVFDFISMSAHANAITTESAFSIFVEEQKTWLIALGYGFIISFLCFVMSLYLLRYSKGSKRRIIYK